MPHRQGKYELDTNVNIVTGDFKVPIGEESLGADCTSAGEAYGPPERKWWKSVILHAYAFVIIFGVLLVFLVSMLLRQIVRVVLLAMYRGRYWLVRDRNGIIWGYETRQSSANIVFVLRCQGVANLKGMIDEFDRKVINYVEEDGSRPYHKLRWKVHRKFGYFCWEEDGKFHLGNHFKLEQVPDEGTKVEDKIKEATEMYLECGLEDSRPQWEFRIIAPTSGKDYIVIFTVHHIYGDGISWMQMFTQALADTPAQLPIDPLRTTRKKEGSEPRSKLVYFLKSLAENLLIYLSIPHMCLAQLVGMLHEKYPGSGTLTSAKRCNWTNKEIPLPRIKELQRANKWPKKPLLFTTVLMAAASNAYFRSHQKRRQIPDQLVAGCPYAMYPYKSLEPTNNFVLTILRFPGSVANGGIPEIPAFNHILSDCTTARRINVNRIGIFMGGSLPLPIMKIAVALTIRCSIGLSNLPGPTQPFSIFGDTVTGFQFLPPIKFRNCVIIGALSYNNKVNVSIGVDTYAWPDPSFPDAFVHNMNQELDSFTSYPQSFMCSKDEEDKVPEIVVHRL